MTLSERILKHPIISGISIGFVSFQVVILFVFGAELTILFRWLI